MFERFFEISMNLEVEGFFTSFLYKFKGNVRNVLKKKKRFKLNCSSFT